MRSLTAVVLAAVLSLGVVVSNSLQDPPAQAVEARAELIRYHNERDVRMLRAHDRIHAIRVKVQRKRAQIRAQRLRAARERAAQEAQAAQAAQAAQESNSSTTVGSYPSGVLSAEEVASYARAAGFPESVIPTMVAIAYRESRFNPGAVNSSSGACGLWQLYPCPGSAAFTPSGNAAGAYAKYQASGLAPWGM